MGHYTSIFQTNEKGVPKRFTPYSADFITVHADLTGLAVVEVQRFWARFQQLGCDHNTGCIPAQTLTKGDLNADAFTRIIIDYLPKEPDGSLSFVVFCKFVNWVENAEDDDKIKAIFCIMNDGGEVNTPIVDRVLSEVYPGATKNQIQSSSDILFGQMDPRNLGYITERAFLSNTRRLYTDKQLKPVLRFETIPWEIVEEVNNQPSTIDVRK